jgi:hypothetical protein
LWIKGKVSKEPEEKTSGSFDTSDTCGIFEIA